MFPLVPDESRENSLAIAPLLNEHAPAIAPLMKRELDQDKS
ncbi:MAG: hypothetical protein AAFR31_21230 [Cyanobacteria bacterium J06627_8]